MSAAAMAIKNLYLAGKLTKEQVQEAYTKKIITVDECDKIIALKQ